MTLRQAGRKLAAANEARRVAVHAARLAAIEAAAVGTPETVIARELGVTRKTVRAWLGKH
jgi:predicted transcriptional regulator